MCCSLNWFFTHLFTWEALAAISAFLTFVAISISLFFVWQQVKTIKEENRIARTFELIKTFSSPDFRKKHEDAIRILNQLIKSTEKFQDQELKKQEVFNDLIELFNRFEGLAVYYNNNLLDNGLIFRMLNDITIKTYNKSESIIKKLRTLYNDQGICINWGALTKVFLEKRKKEWASSKEQ